MKQLIILMIGLLPFITRAQDSKNNNDSTRIVEASCGECKFGMSGKGCQLAVRFDNKSYYVEGTSINDHGDAHAADGFCSAVRQARVSGKVVNDKFVATSFRLLPPETKKP